MEKKKKDEKNLKKSSNITRKDRSKLPEPSTSRSPAKDACSAKAGTSKSPENQPKPIPIIDLCSDEDQGTSLSSLYKGEKSKLLSIPENIEALEPVTRESRLSEYFTKTTVKYDKRKTRGREKRTASKPYELNRSASLKRSSSDQNINKSRLNLRTQRASSEEKENPASKDSNTRKRVRSSSESDIYTPETPPQSKSRLSSNSELSGESPSREGLFAVPYPVGKPSPRKSRASPRKSASPEPSKCKPYTVPTSRRPGDLGVSPGTYSNPSTSSPKKPCFAETGLLEFLPEMSEAVNEIMSRYLVKPAFNKSKFTRTRSVPTPRKRRGTEIHKESDTSVESIVSPPKRRRYLSEPSLVSSSRLSMDRIVIRPEEEPSWAKRKGKLFRKVAKNLEFQLKYNTKEVSTPSTSSCSSTEDCSHFFDRQLCFNWEMVNEGASTSSPSHNVSSTTSGSSTNEFTLNDNSLSDNDAEVYDLLGNLGYSFSHTQDFKDISQEDLDLNLMEASQSRTKVEGFTDNPAVGVIGCTSQELYDDPVNEELILVLYPQWSTVINIDKNKTSLSTITFNRATVAKLVCFNTKHDSIHSVNLFHRNLMKYHGIIYSTSETHMDCLTSTDISVGSTEVLSKLCSADGIASNVTVAIKFFKNKSYEGIVYFNDNIVITKVCAKFSYENQYPGCDETHIANPGVSLKELISIEGKTVYEEINQGASSDYTIGNLYITQPDDILITEEEEIEEEMEVEEPHISKVRPNQKGKTGMQIKSKTKGNKPVSLRYEPHSSLDSDESLSYKNTEAPNIIDVGMEGLSIREPRAGRMGSSHSQSSNDQNDPDITIISEHSSTTLHSSPSRCSLSSRSQRGAFMTQSSEENLANVSIPETREQQTGTQLTPIDQSSRNQSQIVQSSSSSRHTPSYLEFIEQNPDACRVVNSHLLQMLMEYYHVAPPNRQQNYLSRRYSDFTSKYT